MRSNFLMVMAHLMLLLIKHVLMQSSAAKMPKTIAKRISTKCTASSTPTASIYALPSAIQNQGYHILVERSMIGRSSPKKCKSQLFLKIQSWQRRREMIMRITTSSTSCAKDHKSRIEIQINMNNR